MSEYATQLLVQARTFAILDRRRPNQANVRRAVSSAYYAVFHFVMEQATVSLFGEGNASRPLRNVLARAYQHTVIKSVATAWRSAHAALAKGKGPDALPPPIAAALAEIGAGIPTALAEFAAAFVDLQESRHEADYNLAASVSRAEANAIVSVAEKAIMTSWPAVQSHPTTRLFLLSLLVQGQIGRR